MEFQTIVWICISVIVVCLITLFVISRIEKSLHTDEYNFVPKTPSEILRGLGLEDAIKTDDEPNTTDGRAFILLLWIIILAAWGFMVYAGVSWLTPRAPFLGHVLLACVVSFGGLAVTSQDFFIWVAPLLGVVTSNVFTGRFHVFGPGLHVKLPWETIKRGPGGSTLNLQTLPFSATFFTNDGVSIGYSVTVQYSPQLKLLPLMLRIEEAQVKQAIQAVVRGLLSGLIISQSSTELHQGDSVLHLQGTIVEMFRLGSGNEGDEMQMRLGIRVEKVTLSEPTFSESYIDATTARVAASNFIETAERIKKFGRSSEGAMNDALVVGKRAEKNITSIESSDISGGVAAGFEAVIRALRGPKE